MYILYYFDGCKLLNKGYINEFAVYVICPGANICGRMTVGDIYSCFFTKKYIKGVNYVTHDHWKT